MIRYMLYRCLAQIPFVIAIILTKTHTYWFGIVIGVSLVGYAIIWEAITKRERAKLHEIHYEAWVKEMNNLSNTKENW